MRIAEYSDNFLSRRDNGNYPGVTRKARHPWVLVPPRNLHPGRGGGIGCHYVLQISVETDERLTYSASQDTNKRLAYRLAPLGSSLLDAAPPLRPLGTLTKRHKELSHNLRQAEPTDANLCQFPGCVRTRGFSDSVRQFGPLELRWLLR